MKFSKNIMLGMVIAVIPMEVVSKATLITDFEQKEVELGLIILELVSPKKIYKMV